MWYNQSLKICHHFRSCISRITLPQKKFSTIGRNQSTSSKAQSIWMIDLFFQKKEVNFKKTHFLKGFSEAFALGGLDLERQERAKFKKEQEDEHMKNHLAFRAMMNQHRQEAQNEQVPLEVNQQGQQAEQNQQENVVQEEVHSDNDSSQTITHLSTYNSQSQKQSESEKELSKSASKQSLQSDEIEIKQVALEENGSGILENGNTFCTQKDFNGEIIHNLEELD